MNALLALVRLEVRRQRWLFALAAALGAACLALPLVVGVAAPRAVELRTSAAAVVAFALAGLVSAVLALQRFGEDLASGRLGFFWARPISAATLFSGCLLGLAAVALGCLAAALAPVWLFDLAGGGATTADLAASYGGAALGALGLILVGAASVGLVGRARTAWLAVDLAGVAIVAGLFAARLDRFRELHARVERLSTALAAATALLLLAALAAAFVAGRGRAAASHRAFSLTLWPLALAASLGGWLWTGRLLAPTPVDLTERVLATLSPDGRTLLLAGRTSTVEASFAVDVESGRWRPLSWGWLLPTSVAFSPGGEFLAWIDGRPPQRPLTLAQEAAREPARRIELPLEAAANRFAVAVSPDGEWLAAEVAGELRLLWRDGAVRSRLALGAARRVQALRLLAGGRLRVLLGFAPDLVPGPDPTVSLEVLELAPDTAPRELGTRPLASLRAAIGPPGWAHPASFDAGGERLLVLAGREAVGEEAPAQGRLAPRTWLLLAVSEGLPAVAELEVPPSARPALLPDGGWLAPVEQGGAFGLRRYDAAGRPSGEVTLPRGSELIFGGSEGDALALSVATHGGEQGGGWRGFEADLARGTLAERGPGLVAVGARGLTIASGPALFLTAENDLVRFDRRTGERRSLLVSR